MIASTAATVIAVLVLVVAGFGSVWAIVWVGDDRRHPPPSPPAAHPPAPVSFERDLSDDEVRRMVAAWQRASERAARRADLDRERAAAELIDRVFPDPNIPKGER